MKELAKALSKEVNKPYGKETNKARLFELFRQKGSEERAKPRKLEEKNESLSYSSILYEPKHCKNQSGSLDGRLEESLSTTSRYLVINSR